MANSILNSDDGSVSGSAGLKFTAGDDGVLKIQNNGTDALTVSDAGVVTFAQQPVNPVPVFEAYLGTTATLTNNAFIVMPLGVVSYDTESWYNTSNYRYTPQLAGYYLFNFTYTHSGTTNTTAQISTLYKNGSLFKYLFFNRYAATSASLTAGGSALVYMNGTTDYVQPFYYTLGSGTLTAQAGQTYTYFQGSLVRAA